MSINELIPRILVERYGNHSKGIIRSLIYRMRQWNSRKKKFSVGEDSIRLIYFTILKKYPSVRSQLQRLVESYKNGDVTPRIDKILFHDIYQSDGKPHGAYPELTFRVEEEVRKVISFLADKGVLEAVDYGFSVNYGVNTRVYLSNISNKT